MLVTVFAYRGRREFPKQGGRSDGEGSPLISLEKFTGEVGQSVLPQGGSGPPVPHRSGWGSFSHSSMSNYRTNPIELVSDPLIEQVAALAERREPIDMGNRSRPRSLCVAGRQK